MKQTRLYLGALLFIIGLTGPVRAANIAIDTLYNFEGFTSGTTLTTADAPLSIIGSTVGLTVESINGSQAMQLVTTTGGDEIRMDFAGGTEPTSGTFEFDYSLQSTLGTDLRLVLRSSAGDLLRMILTDAGDVTYLSGNGSGGSSAATETGAFSNLSTVFNSFSVNVDTASDVWGFSVGSTNISGLSFQNDRDASDITAIVMRAQGGSYTGAIDNVQFVTVPEPSTYALVLVASGLLWILRRKLA
ncbi:MAG: PEP-CTERM sorting domain-containing protein [Verrucomicrobiota bacterium]